MGERVNSNGHFLNGPSRAIALHRIKLRTKRIFSFSFLFYIEISRDRVETELDVVYLVERVCASKVSSSFSRSSLVRCFILPRNIRVFNPIKLCKLIRFD